MSNIIKNTSLYTVGNILPQIVGFFLLPIFTRYLNPSDYGIIGSMEVLSEILAIFITLAVERSIYRLYWDFKTDKEKEEFLGSIVLVLIGISTSVLILLFILKELVGLIYVSIPFFPFYAYAIVTEEIEAVDIDTEVDFMISEALIQHREK